MAPDGKIRLPGSAGWRLERSLCASGAGKGFSDITAGLDLQ
jgi:hypothetical protein